MSVELHVYDKCSSNSIIQVFACGVKRKRQTPGLLFEETDVLKISNDVFALRFRKDMIMLEKLFLYIFDIMLIELISLI